MFQGLLLLKCLPHTVAAPYASPCLLFVAGGLVNNEDRVAPTEFVDLCPEDGYICPQSSDLPVLVDESWGVSLRTSDGNPLLCGLGDSQTLCKEFLPGVNTFQDGLQTIYPRGCSAITEVPSLDEWWLLSAYYAYSGYVTTLS